MSIQQEQTHYQDLEIAEDSLGPWDQDDYEGEYDSGMLCAHCHQEEPMYPRKDSQDSCHILCADCYWDEDYAQKHRRNVFYTLHPEEYEAYRKQAAETLGVAYSPLPNAKSETEDCNQQWVLEEKKEDTEQNKIEFKSIE